MDLFFGLLLIIGLVFFRFYQQTFGTGLSEPTQPNSFQLTLCNPIILNENFKLELYLFFSCLKFIYLASYLLLYFFWIRGNLTLEKRILWAQVSESKPRLSQAFTRDARPDSNSRPAVQISSPLPSRYSLETLFIYLSTSQ